MARVDLSIVESSAARFRAAEASFYRDIVDAVDEGASLRDVAAAAGVSHTKVRRLVEARDARNRASLAAWAADHTMRVNRRGDRVYSSCSCGWVSPNLRREIEDVETDHARHAARPGDDGEFV